VPFPRLGGFRWDPLFGTVRRAPSAQPLLRLACGPGRPPCRACALGRRLRCPSRGSPASPLRCAACPALRRLVRGLPAVWGSLGVLPWLGLGTWAPLSCSRGSAHIWLVADLLATTNRHLGHLAVKEQQLRRAGASSKAACKKEAGDSCTPTLLESQLIEDSPQELLPISHRLQDFASRHCSLRAPKGRHYNLPTHYRTQLSDFEVRARVARTFAEVSSQDLERVERLAVADMPPAVVQTPAVCPEGSPKRLKSDACAADLAAADLVPPMPGASVAAAAQPPRTTHPYCRRSWLH
jgi:hypothetical protein